MGRAQKDKYKGKTSVRFYCATWNNYTDDDIEFLEYYAHIHLDYLIYGKEVGKEEETPHLQIYMYKHNTFCFNTLKEDLPLLHFEPSKRKDIGEAIWYCTKEDPDYVEIGTRPQQGKRNDLGCIYRMIKRGKSQYEVMDEYPEKYAQYWRGFKQMKKLTRKHKIKETILILYKAESLSHSILYRKYMIKPYYFIKENEDVWPIYHKHKYKFIFIDVTYDKYGTVHQLKKDLDFFKISYIDIDAEGFSKEDVQEKTETKNKGGQNA